MLALERGWKLRTTLYTTAAFQYLSVFTGLAWAEAAKRYPDCVPTLWLVPAALGLGLLAAAAYRMRAHDRSLGGVAARRVTVAMLIYSGLILCLDPFAGATNEKSCFVGVALAVVPLLCLKVLVRRKAWLAVWGVILSQAAAVASLFYNASSWWGGTGYFPFMYRVVH
jgi:hypothetical protein